MPAKPTPDYVVNPVTGCWEFTKHTRMGYGRFIRDGKLRTAHVWLWEQENGPVPEGLELDHLCHDPTTCAGGVTCPHRRCVNPAHLEAVPRKTNVRRGCLAKITAADAAYIKGHPRTPIAELAERFGITPVEIQFIRAGRAWNDIEPAPSDQESRRVMGLPIMRRTTPLTAAEIEEIRSTPKLYGSGRELAHKFGVTEGMISKIRTGQSGEGRVI